MSLDLINLTAACRAGRDQDRLEHIAEEVTKFGNLRAGNTGIRSPETGDVAASCHRKAYLRSQNIEVDPPTDQKIIMFQLGYASEDIIVNDLRNQLPANHIILREKEIPIEWLTSNGTKVTGRPDIVICSTSINLSDTGPKTFTAPGPIDGLRQLVTPVLGLELKSVHSVWTARDVLFGGAPKLSNVAQAAHYMWKLGIPYKLMYKGYSALGQGMAWSDKMASMFPKYGEGGSEFMVYNEKTGKPKEVGQFEITYDLRLDHSGRVSYSLEGRDRWTQTLVSVKDIEEFYEFTSQMASRNDLGPRPMTLDIHGEKEGYKMCGYCPLEEICDRAETGKWTFERWLLQVKAAQPAKPETSEIPWAAEAAAGLREDYLNAIVYGEDTSKYVTTPKRRASK